MATAQKYNNNTEILKAVQLFIYGTKNMWTQATFVSSTFLVALASNEWSEEGNGKLLTLRVDSTYGSLSSAYTYFHWLKLALRCIHW